MDSPRLDAQVLLAHVLDCDKVSLYTQFDKPLGTSELASYRGLIKQRLTGVPVAYLIGKKEFYSHEFVVDSRVLIPRPDTEILVDRALDVIKQENVKSILELCTGSGAVSIVLALNTNVEKIVASDVCEEALNVAKINRDQFSLEARIDCVLSDLWEHIPKDVKFDLIVCNPPYIPTEDIERCSKEVRKEPNKALDGGVDGLDFYRRIFAQCSDYIQAGGRLLLEHGEGQRESIESLIPGSGGHFVEAYKDLAGLERTLEIKF